jgi:hypothetical protein
MKKLFILLSLLIACGSVPSKVPEPPPCADAKAGEICVPSPAPIGVITTQIIRGEDWSIAIPLGYQKKDLPTVLPVGVTGAMYVSKSNVVQMLIMMREEDQFSKLDQEAFMLRIVQRMGEGTTIGTPQGTLINGAPFLMVEVKKDMIKMFVFVHLEKDVAHLVMCGGLTFDRELAFDCRAMVKTYKMN